VPDVTIQIGGEESPEQSGEQAAENAIAGELLQQHMELEEHVDDALERQESVTREQFEGVASALDIISDAVGNLEEVVAALISHADSVVDYLEEVHEEREEADPAAEPNTPVPAKASKVVAEREPRPPHRFRTFVLGGSGGRFPS
jgi:hypothetical protein